MEGKCQNHIQLWQSCCLPEELEDSVEQGKHSGLSKTLKAEFMGGDIKSERKQQALVWSMTKHVFSWCSQDV